MNNRAVSYALDPAGNRTSVVDAGATSSYTPNVLNQYGSAGADPVTNGSEHEICTQERAKPTRDHLDGRKDATVFGPKEKVSEKMQEKGPGPEWKLSPEKDKVVDPQPVRPLFFTEGK